MPSVELDMAAIEAAAAESEDVKNGLAEAAESIADVIRSSTPGRISESIGVSELTNGYRVFSDDFVTVWYEFGTGMRHTRAGANRGEEPAYHPFLHAAEGSGLRYDPSAEGE